jgi:hypothetical protein
MVAQSRLFAAALAATATTTQHCDYSANERCINPQVTASAAIPFSPLFHSPPKFVYAIDELDEEDKAAEMRRSPRAIPSTYLGTVLKAAFWLEYDRNSLNDARSQSRKYYTFVLETSATKKATGSSNECATLLGAKCLRNLKNLIARQTYGALDGVDGGLGTAISGLYANPPEDLGCPADLFGTRWDSPTLDPPILLQSEEYLPLHSKGRKLIDIQCLSLLHATRTTLSGRLSPRGTRVSRMASPSSVSGVLPSRALVVWWASRSAGLLSSMGRRQTTPCRM